MALAKKKKIGGTAQGGFFLGKQRTADEVNTLRREKIEKFGLFSGGQRFRTMVRNKEVEQELDALDSGGTAQQPVIGATTIERRNRRSVRSRRRGATGNVVSKRSLG